MTCSPQYCSCGIKLCFVLLLINVNASKWLITNDSFDLMVDSGLNIIFMN